MTTTIHSKVNPRLLTKANRLFTGTLTGRIIEVLQNARRAGATAVEITNRNGIVTVQDNGRGIENFEALLDLGGSGWDQRLEGSEDPAGVGLFCLAPRELLVRSRGYSVTIEGDGWTGSPVEVIHDQKCPPVGTQLRFMDDPWSLEAVEPLAVFTGLIVTVDGKRCAQEPFIAGDAVHVPDLGCRIAIVSSAALTRWHRTALSSRQFRIHGVLVNFHGQIVNHDDWPVSEYSMLALVELTGEPTGIRLMLPARTQLVENEALKSLQAEVERATYRHIQKRGRHTLPYKEFERARELGIELREAEPVFQVGLLATDIGPEPVEVVKPDEVPLDRCYRLSAQALDADESAEANAHILGALGQFALAFVPVQIQSRYDGYSWTKLRTIDRIEVEASEVLHKDWLWSGRLICVRSLKIRARTSDGLTWQSDVPMAVRPDREDFDELYVTPEARNRVVASAIWHHVGGYNEEGDTYETQEYEFERELNRFWAELLGPDEPLRTKIFDVLDEIKEPWQSVFIKRSGAVHIRGVGDDCDEFLEPGFWIGFRRRYERVEPKRSNRTADRVHRH